jgi:hypothetical protein
MHDMLSKDTNLPEWVQGKITLAEDYIVSATQYMQSEMTEEVEMSEGSYNFNPGYESKNKRIQKKAESGMKKNWKQYAKNTKLPRSQRRSALIATDPKQVKKSEWGKHGNRYVKHAYGPHMGESTENTTAVGEANLTPYRNTELGVRSSKRAGQPRASNSRQFFRPPEGFTKKGIEKGKGKITVPVYKKKK